MSRKDISNTCGTCKYDSVRATDPPCNACFHGNYDCTSSQWEPMRNDAHDKNNAARADLIKVLEKIEDILHSSSLTWLVSYIPDTKSYSIYLSDATDVDPDE